MRKISFNESITIDHISDILIMPTEQWRLQVICD